MFGGEDSDILFLRSIWDFHIQSRIWSKMCKIVAILYFQDLARFDRRPVYFFAFSRNNGIVIVVVVHQFSAMIIKTIESSVILWNS